MGIYVEVHCDVRREGRDPDEPTASFCWTHRNDNPMGRSVSDVKAQAKSQGWKLSKDNHATCPNCAGDREPFWFGRNEQVPA